MSAPRDVSADRLRAPAEKDSMHHARTFLAESMTTIGRCPYHAVVTTTRQLTNSVPNAAAVRDEVTYIHFAVHRKDF